MKQKHVITILAAALLALAGCGGGGGGTMPLSTNDSQPRVIMIDEKALDSAVEVSVGDLLSGSLSSTNEVDYYKVQIDGPGRLVIGIEDENLIVRVFTPDGEEIPTRTGSTVADILESTWEKIADKRGPQLIIAIYHRGKDVIETAGYVYGQKKEDAVNFYRDITGLTEADQLAALEKANDRLNEARNTIRDKKDGNLEPVNRRDLTRLKTAIDALDTAWDAADKVASDAKEDYQQNIINSRARYQDYSREFELDNLQVAANKLERALIVAENNVSLLSIENANAALEVLKTALDTSEYLNDDNRKRYQGIYDNGRDTLQEFRNRADQSEMQEPKIPENPVGLGLNITAGGQINIGDKVLNVTHFERTDGVSNLPGGTNQRYHVHCPGTDTNNTQCTFTRITTFLPGVGESELGTDLLSGSTDASFSRLRQLFANSDDGVEELGKLYGMNMVNIPVQLWTEEEGANARARNEAILDQNPDILDDINGRDIGDLLNDFGLDTSDLDFLRDLDSADLESAIRNIDQITNIKISSYGGYGQWMVFHTLDNFTTEDKDDGLPNIWIGNWGSAFGELYKNESGPSRPSANPGSAIWSGAMVGREPDSANAIGDEHVHGKSELEYNFSNHTVDVRFTNMVRRKSGNPASEPSWSWNDVPVNTDASFFIPGHGNHQPDQNPHNTRGYIDGDFYGPQGQEAAGVFELPKGMVGAFGAVRGK